MTRLPFPRLLWRAAAAAAGLLAGLALAWGCLGVASAAGAQSARPAAPAGAVWHVAANPGEGLVGYWKFDDLRDSTSLNSALLSQPAVFSGGASLTTTVPATVTVPDTDALALDGVADLAQVPDSAGLNLQPNGFSVAAWVRRNDNSAYDTIYDSGTETNKWWVFIASNNKFGFGVRDLSEIYSTRTITDTNWHHLALVVTGAGVSTVKFYVDGVASGVLTTTNVLQPSGAKRIGALLDGIHGLKAFFKGSLDEVRLYNRALSAAEVGRLAAGRGCVTDGSTWPTAFADLQCALDVAQNGDQIWLAGGTYRPGANPQIPFHLVNGVDVFGGFAGNETSPSQRPAFNPDAPITTLSGDIRGDDVPASFGHYDENNCNVVLAGDLGFPSAFNATVDGLAIQDGNAEDPECGSFLSTANGGGLAHVSPGQFALNNIVFRANRTTGRGGALLHVSGIMTLNGVHFISNTTTDTGVGGGLMVSGGSVTITASSFLSNTGGRGGALDIEPVFPQITRVSLSQVTFDHSTARDGGAVEAQNITGTIDLSFSQVTFTNNQATAGDGGAYAASAVDPAQLNVRFSHATFSHNLSDDEGGGLQHFGGSLTIDSSSFISNTGQVGGGLSVQGPVTITNSLFQDNVADDGGGVRVIGALIMSGTELIQNQGIDPGPATDFAPIGGGAFVDGPATITNSQFLSNTAFLQSEVLDTDLSGGGGLAVTGFLLLNGDTFQNNTARQGGGVQALSASLIQASLFQNNTAGEGGGLFAAGAVQLFTSRLVNNTAFLSDNSHQPGRGGGLFLQDTASASQISDNLFLGNQALSADEIAPSGAAMELGGQVSLVSNNTIVSHVLLTTSAASVFSGTLVFANNLVTSHSVALEDQAGFGLFEDHNLFSGDTLTATGIISAGGHSRIADPRFVAAGQNDFRLRLDSPAVDAGDNNRVPHLVTTDLGGGARFIDVPSVPDTGAGSAPLVDIGAFEVNDQLFLPLVGR